MSSFVLTNLRIGGPRLLPANRGFDVMSIRSWVSNTDAPVVAKLIALVAVGSEVVIVEAEANK